MERLCYLQWPHHCRLSALAWGGFRGFVPRTRTNICRGGLMPALVLNRAAQALLFSFYTDDISVSLVFCVKIEKCM